MSDSQCLMLGSSVCLLLRGDEACACFLAQQHRLAHCCFLLSVKAPLLSSRLRRLNLTAKTGVAFVGYDCSWLSSLLLPGCPSLAAALPGALHNRRVLSAPPAQNATTNQSPIIVVFFSPSSFIRIMMKNATTYIQYIQEASYHTCICTS